MGRNIGDGGKDEREKRMREEDEGLLGGRLRDGKEDERWKIAGRLFIIVVRKRVSLPL